MKPYKFASKLIEGVILKRPNRFVMSVKLPGVEEEVRCHCPVTGGIMNLDFNRDSPEGIPCLLHPTMSKSAKTKYTVEAISLDSPVSERKSWIGINQNRANRYVEHFLSTNALSESLGMHTDTLRREVKVGNSKLDFVVNDNHFIEVKTPLSFINTDDHPRNIPLEQRTKGVSRLSDRLTRHFTELRKILEKDATARSSIIILFLADAEPFQPEKEAEEERLRQQTNKKRPVETIERKDGKTKRIKADVRAPPEPGKSESAFDKRLKEVRKIIREANAAGVRQFQVNVKVTPEHVELLKIFEFDPKTLVYTEKFSAENVSKED